MTHLATFAAPLTLIAEVHSGDSSENDDRVRVTSRQRGGRKVAPASRGVNVRAGCRQVGLIRCTLQVPGPEGDTVVWARNSPTSLTA